jgi:hypothetical protein
LGRACVKVSTLTKILSFISLNYKSSPKTRLTRGNGRCYKGTHSLQENCCLEQTYKR